MLWTVGIASNFASIAELCYIEQQSPEKLQTEPIGWCAGAVRQWKLPEVMPTSVDPIMASYAYLSKDPLSQPQIQS